MRFGAGLVTMRAEGDTSSVPDADASIMIWARSFLTGIGTPKRIDNHERRADSNESLEAATNLRLPYWTCESHIGRQLR